MTAKVYAVTGKHGKTREYAAVFDRYAVRPEFVIGDGGMQAGDLLTG